MRLCYAQNTYVELAHIQVLFDFDADRVIKFLTNFKAFSVLFLIIQCKIFCLLFIGYVYSFTIFYRLRLQLLQF